MIPGLFLMVCSRAYAQDIPMLPPDDADGASGGANKATSEEDGTAIVDDTAQDDTLDSITFPDDEDAKEPNNSTDHGAVNPPPDTQPTNPGQTNANYNYDKFDDVSLLYPGGPNCEAFTTQDAFHDCPKKYKLDSDGNKCLRRITRTPDSFCVDGVDAPDGDSCVINETGFPAYACPDGFTRYGKICSKTEIMKKKLVCPKGFEISGIQCERKAVAAPILTCPENSILRGGECHNILSKANVQSCDPEFSLTSDGYCIKETKAASKASCEFGFNDNETSCTKITHYPAEIGCPEGFDSNTYTNQCIRKIKVAKTAVCREGVLENNMCRVSGPYSKDCKGPNCVTTTYSKPIMNCPQSFILEHGECVSFDRRKGEMYCMSGDELENGQCTHVVERKKKLTCDDDYNLTSTGCVRLEAYKLHNNCADTARNGNISSECEVSVTTQPTKSCPSGFLENFDDGKCIAKEFVSGDLICPAGYSQNSSNDCVRLTEQAPSPQCESGYELLRTMCVRSQNFPKGKFCPDGYKFDGSMCYLDTTTDSLRSCPENTLYNDHLDMCFTCA